MEVLFEPDNCEESYYDSYNKTQQYYEEELYAEPERSTSLYAEPAVCIDRFPPRCRTPKVCLECTCEIQ